MASRGVGSFLAAFVVTRVSNRVDARILIGIGLALNAVALFMLAGMSLLMNGRLIVISGFIQGLGSGTVFAPLATLAFATLDYNLRNEGTSMFTLIRNLGSSSGISILQALSYRSSQQVHSQLIEGLRPDNPIVATMSSQYTLSDPLGMSLLTNEVERQAIMVSYIDVFWGLAIVSVLFIGTILFLSKPRKLAPGMRVHVE